MTNIAVRDTVSIYDADPVMCRVARATSLALLSALTLFVLAIAIVVLGWLGLVLFVAGSLLIVPEIVVERRRH